MANIKDRIYNLKIGNNAEILEIDGTERRHLRIRFSIDIAAGWVSYAEFEINNLNQETQRKVIEEFTFVEFTAGYRDFSGPLFSGQIITTERMSEGGTTSLKLFCKSAGAETKTITFNKSYQPGAAWSQIVTDCARTFGYPVDIIGEITGQALNGYSSSGDARSELNKLAGALGFAWTVDRGVLYIHREGAISQGAQPVYTRKTGLLGVPVVTVFGVEMDVALSSTVRRGMPFRVESEFAEKALSNNYYAGETQLALTTIEGQFYVFSANHSGDTHGDEWRTRINGFRRR